MEKRSSAAGFIIASGSDHICSSRSNVYPWPKSRVQSSRDARRVFRTLSTIVKKQVNSSHRTKPAPGESKETGNIFQHILRIEAMSPLCRTGCRASKSSLVPSKSSSLTAHTHFYAVLPRLCSRTNASGKEVGSSRRIRSVGEVSRGDGQSASTDQVTRVAEDSEFLTREIWDLATILQVLSITEGHNTINAVLHILWQVLNSTVAHRCSLAAKSQWEMLKPLAHRLTYTLPRQWQHLGIWKPHW